MMTIQTLTDANSFAMAQLLSDEILESQWRMKLQYLAKRGWSAIVLPGGAGDAVDGKPEPSLLAAMRENETTGYFALTSDGYGFKGFASADSNASGLKNPIFLEWQRLTGGVASPNWILFQDFLKEHQGDIEWCYEFGSSAGDIMNFLAKNSLEWMLIVPNSKSFLILTISFDFHVLAGTKAFIESAIGESLEKIRERIKTPGEYWDLEEEKNRFEDIRLYESLDSQYGNLK
jgi:hypothetical protein